MGNLVIEIGANGDTQSLRPDSRLSISPLAPFPIAFFAVDRAVLTRDERNGGLFAARGTDAFDDRFRFPGHGGSRQRNQTGAAVRGDR